VLAATKHDAATSWQAIRQSSANCRPFNSPNTKTPQAIDTNTDEPATAAAITAAREEAAPAVLPVACKATAANTNIPPPIPSGAALSVSRHGRTDESSVVVHSAVKRNEQMREHVTTPVNKSCVRQL